MKLHIRITYTDELLSEVKLILTTGAKGKKRGLPGSAPTRGFCFFGVVQSATPVDSNVHQTVVQLDGSVCNESRMSKHNYTYNNPKTQQMSKDKRSSFSVSLSVSHIFHFICDGQKST